MGIINEARAAAQKLESTRESKYDELFDAEELELLKAYVRYLVDTCGFEKTSASSYRTNYARACSKIAKGEALNSDENSTLRKFETFMEWREAAPTTTPVVELDADEALLAELEELDED